MFKNRPNLKLMTILGTRPEIIRLCRILPKLDKYFKHLIVYTGQSFDYEMSDIFFKQLELRRPDYILKVQADSLGRQIANIIKQTETVLVKEKPDALLILGDTNSSLSAIMARRLKIPIFHMEAGNRAFDWDVPEEINRRIVDHISNFNLAYTEQARHYLLVEGIHPGTIFVIGSPYAEIFAYFRKKIELTRVINDLKLKTQQYFVVNIQREENVENKKNLQEIFDALNFLAKEYQLPIVISLHPRTKKKLSTLGKLNHLISIHRPFGFLEYTKLELDSFCVLSDSGTIAEESAILGFPAVQVRTSSERPEAFEAGSIILTGFNKETIFNAVKLTLAVGRKPVVIPHDYLDINVSDKIVKLIMGKTSIHKYQQN